MTKYVVQNKTGLHARPIQKIITILKTNECAGKVSNESKGINDLNALSMVSFLKLAGTSGDTISFAFEDKGETEKAKQELQEFFDNAFGEDRATNLSPKAQEPKEEENIQNTPKTKKVMQPEGEDGFLIGIGVAPGFGLGKKYILKSIDYNTLKEKGLSVKEEEKIFKDAKEKSFKQLNDIVESLSAKGKSKEGIIFKAHVELLEDPELEEGINKMIQEGYSAEYSIYKVVDKEAKAQEKTGNQLLALRAADLRDVGSRIIKNINNINTDLVFKEDEKIVLLAKDVEPSLIATIDTKNVIGIITTEGGSTSHSAILAKSLGIPYIVGCSAFILENTHLEKSENIIMNGTTGEVYVYPTKETEEKTAILIKEEEVIKKEAEKNKDLPAVTTDGKRIEVCANIASVNQSKKVLESGAEGVGLLRTEFVFMSESSEPSLEQQTKMYKDIAINLNGNTLVVRTLDIGGDKPIEYFDMEPELNPYLGVRGVRFTNERKDVAKRQFTALLKTAKDHPLHIMFPMISDIDEFLETKAFLEELNKDIKAEYKIGTMIEVPSAVFMADELAKHLDFFSIGSNDLTQYLLAMDRTNIKLIRQIDSLHPSMLRALKHVIDSSHKHGKWTGVCGEMASDPVAAVILIGLGVDELSVSLPRVSLVKQSVRNVSFKKCQELAEKALKLTSTKEIRNLVIENLNSLA